MSSEDGPRVTTDAIDALIKTTSYYVFPETTVTVCCIELESGYCVIGHSACASPENFNAELGQSLAYADAYCHIWALEGYRLKLELHSKAQKQ